MRFSNLIIVTMTSIFMALPALASEKLRNLEYDCWNKAIDDDGTFLCSYIVVMALRETDQKRFVPEVMATDDGGPQTTEQAWRVCRAMGFTYLRREDVPSKRHVDLR